MQERDRMQVYEKLENNRGNNGVQILACLYSINEHSVHLFSLDNHHGSIPSIPSKRVLLLSYGGTTLHHCLDFCKGN